MALAEIASTDFLRPLLNEAGIWHEMELEFASIEARDRFLGLADIDEQRAVIDYLITGKGRMELVVLLRELQKIHETVRLHLLAELTRKKVQRDASEEILKVDGGDFFVMEFILKGVFIGRADFAKGKEIFDQVSEEMVMENLESFIGALIENPNLVSDWTARFNEADKRFCASIRPNQFPDNDTLKRGIEIVTKEDWTSNTA